MGGDDTVQQRTDPRSTTWIGDLESQGTRRPRLFFKASAEELAFLSPEKALAGAGVFFYACAVVGTAGKLYTLGRTSYDSITLKELITMNTPESMKFTIQGIFRTLQLAERLKFELRHSWLSNGRQESVAEHTWQMTLMAVLMYRHLEHSIDVEHVLKMIIIHDLIEAEAGDVPFFETGARKEAKATKEREAIEKIREMLEPQTGQEVYDLWHEFETGKTQNAKFAKALDNLEVQLQHNRADFNTWEEIEFDLVYTKMDKHCSHDAFLKQLCDFVKSEAEVKMQQGGVDVERVRRRTENI